MILAERTDDFREDNADYYKLGDYIKKIPNETN